MYLCSCFCSLCPVREMKHTLNSWTHMVFFSFRLPGGFTQLKNLTVLGLNDMSLTNLPYDFGWWVLGPFEGLFGSFWSWSWVIWNLSRSSCEMWRKRDVVVAVDRGSLISASSPASFHWLGVTLWWQFVFFTFSVDCSGGVEVLRVWLNMEIHWEFIFI